MEHVTTGHLFQNVMSSMEQVSKIINCDPNVFIRLKQPRRCITVSVPVRMDDYKVRVFTGHRVQYSSSLGPYKGGIRYHQDVNVSEVAGLAALMTFKTSLLQLPLGGAKGGVAVDPTKLSRTEKQNLTRRFTTEIGPFIGPHEDIPAPDMGTDAQTMAWMMDTYSQQKGFAQPGVVTGKPVAIGGSLGRTSSTGHGVVYTAEKTLEKLGKKISGTTFAIQGYGNVGRHAANLANTLGSKVIAISDVESGIFNPDGLNLEEVNAYIEENKGLKGYPNAEAISNETLLELEVDVLAPCAVDNVINEKNWRNIKAKIIVEGANGPTDRQAGEELTKKGVYIVPDILANGGGVIVSYFEWVQDIANHFWDLEQVNKSMKKVITRAFDEVWDFAESEQIDLRQAAMGVALKRLEKAMLLRGLYPR